MGQSTARILTSEQRILKYVDMANQSGKRFAYKNEKYEPECQAEARFILTHLILVEHELLDKAENEIVFLKIAISRRLKNYFRNKQNTERVGVHPKQGRMVGEFKEDQSDDISLIDELEMLFPHQKDIIQLWRNGFDLAEMMFLNPRSVKVVKEMLFIRKKLERSRKASRKKMEAAA